MKITYKVNKQYVLYGKYTVVMEINKFVIVILFRVKVVEKN